MQSIHMNHPSPDDLLLYLDGEASTELTDRVRQHLNLCSHCRIEMEGWKRSVQRLRNLPFRAADAGVAQLRYRSNRMFQIARWAVAAALVLFCGVGIGRLSAPSEARMKAAVADELRGQLRQQLGKDLLIALAAEPSGAVDDFQKHLRTDVQNALANNGGNSLSTVSLALKQEKEQRETDRAYLVTLINRIREQQAADYLALRRDLETAASVADNDLEQNRERIALLTQTLFAQADHKSP